MAEAPFDEKKAHRWFAIEFNNGCWDWLEASGETTPEEPERIVHEAHASCYHWMQVGNVANHARGECLVGNVHAACGQGDAAVRHAKRCVALVEGHPDETTDWDLAFAYDCFARATAAAGNTEEAKKLKQKARELGDNIAEPPEKKVFDSWFAAGKWHGV